MATATDPRNESPARCRCDGCSKNERAAMKFRSACRLMKVRRTRTAAGASQPAAQVDGGIVLAEPLDQARHVEHVAVLAAPAHSNECHACTRELAERALLLVRAVEGVGCEVQGF